MMLETKLRQASASRESGSKQESRQMMASIGERERYQAEQAAIKEKDAKTLAGRAILGRADAVDRSTPLTDKHRQQQVSEQVILNSDQARLEQKWNPFKVQAEDSIYGHDDDFGNHRSSDGGL